MTPKEYLSQAYRLEQIIKVTKLEIDTLKSMMYNVSSPSFEERNGTSFSRDASFVKTIYKIDEMTKKNDEQLEQLLKLRAQIQYVISQINNKDCMLVLTYRYLHNWSWRRIGKELFADEKTVRRWHEVGLKEVKLPNDFIEV